MKLFNAIDSQEKYDEKAIRDKFKDERFINQLHVTKIYLSQLILKCLRNYYQNASVNSDILDLIRDIEILFNKELFDQCAQTIQKAQRLAEKYEKINLLSEILFWKKRLNLTVHGANQRLISKINLEELANIQKLTSLNHYWKFIAEASQFNSPGNEQKGISRELMFSVAGKPQTVRANILMHHVLYSQGVTGKKSQQVETHLNELIALIESHPHLIKDDPGTYINTLNNKTTFLILQRRYQEVLPLLNKIRSIPEIYGVKHHHKLRIRTMLRTYNIEMELYRDLKEIAKGVKLMSTISKFIERHEKSVPDNYYILFWNQFANICYLNNDLAGSLVWLNKIIQSRITSRMDIQRYARLLHLIIHFDLGNVIFLRYSIDACRRFIKKHGNLNKFERICLKHFAKLSHSAASDYRRQFEKFHHDLFVHHAGLVTNNVLDYLDIASWLSRKLNIEKIPAVR